jgi:hypothetical protein
MPGGATPRRPEARPPGPGDSDVRRLEVGAGSIEDAEQRRDRSRVPAGRRTRLADRNGRAALTVDEARVG